MRAKTYRSTRYQDLGELLADVNRSLAGWANYFPARGVQDDLQCGRLLRMGPTHALDTRQTRRQNRLSMTELGRRFCDQGWRFAYNGSFHRRLRRRNDPLPLLLPRQHHTDPMDHQTGSCRHRQWTNGQDT